MHAKVHLPSGVTLNIPCSPNESKLVFKQDALDSIQEFLNDVKTFVPPPSPLTRIKSIPSNIKHLFIRMYHIFRTFAGMQTFSWLLMCGLTHLMGGRLHFLPYFIWACTLICLAIELLSMLEIFNTYSFLRSKCVPQIYNENEVDLSKLDDVINHYLKEGRRPDIDVISKYLKVKCSFWQVIVLIVLAALPWVYRDWRNDVDGRKVKAFKIVTKEYDRRLNLKTQEEENMEASVRRRETDDFTHFESEDESFA